MLFFNQTLLSSENCSSFSRTFFRTRSVIEDVNFFLALNQYNFYQNYFVPCCYASINKNAHISIGAFFEKTQNSKIGNYFFPGCAEANKETETESFESIIMSLEPERKIVGVYFDYHQDFCFLNGIWFDIKTAFYEATHNLNANELVLNSIDNIEACSPLSFLSSEELLYSRIPTCKLKKKGIDDIEIKLGAFLLNCPDYGYYLGIYSSFLIPTAPKPNAEFLFEPLIGRGHFGIGTGSNAAVSIYKSENSSITLLTDCSYQFLFNNEETRSLDFKAGGLTRYILASPQNNRQDLTPAVNLTTLCLNVEPGSTINIWAALHFQYSKLHTEFGYNYWWRNKEKISFQKNQKDRIDLDIGIFIDDEFIPINSNNLDLNSASHPSTSTNKVYLALAFDVCCINFGIGATYEFSNNIKAFDQWGLWGNLQISF